MHQTVKSNLYFYVDDSLLIYQHIEVAKLNLKFSKNIFKSISNWYVENKLCIHFGEGTAKLILFASRRKS